MSNHPNRGRPSKGANHTPEQIRNDRLRAELTQTEAGAVIYYGLRGWQKFEAEAGTPANNRMHPALKELWDFKVFGKLPPKIVGRANETGERNGRQIKRSS